MPRAVSASRIQSPRDDIIANAPQYGTTNTMLPEADTKQSATPGSGGTALRVLIWGLYAIVPLIVLAVAIHRPGVTGYPRAMLEDHVYGRAYRPFVKRHLVPLIVRGGVAVLPDSAKSACQSVCVGIDAERRWGWNCDYATEFCLVVAVMYVSLLGFLIVLRQFVLQFINAPPWVGHGITLGTALLLPVTFAGQAYLYDFTQLFLFTTALLFMYQRRWRLYYPILALACINKETSVLLPLILTLAWWFGQRRRGDLAHAVVQWAIAIGICALIGWVFRSNPGGTVEWHFRRNATLSIGTLGLGRLVLLLGVVVVAAIQFRRSAFFVRCCFIGTLPPLFLSCVLFGWIDELRGYYDALPAIVVMCAYCLSGKMNITRRGGDTGGESAWRAVPA